jgi:histidinol dehydrogenase
MIQTVDLRDSRYSADRYREIVPRAGQGAGEAVRVAADLVREVREGGAAALREQAERFDGGAPEHVRQTAAELSRAVDELEPAVRESLEESIRRVRHATRAQMPVEPQHLTRLADGASVLQRWLPVARAGLYVPGGKAPLASSVIMNAVPAQVAGVTSIALASPPQRAFGGAVHPTILATAALLGLDEVYAMGGAGAIGALAWGVQELGLDPVDVISGPGNMYVAAAKRAVRGVVGIDVEAGPSEILIIADDSADPDLVAADLISQAEHDEAAASILVTDSPDLAGEVVKRLAERVPATKHADRVRAALGGRQSAIILVPDIPAAAAFSNSYGPEHLELQTRDPAGLAETITAAGAVFLGPYSPVSLGDYMAGSNHVLPTGGQARFSPGLGAYSFLRPQQVISYDAAALRQVADRIVTFAEAEDLPAHGEAIAARIAADSAGAALARDLPGERPVG